MRLGAILIMSAWVGWILIERFTLSLVPHPYVAHYIRGDCFQFDQVTKKEVDGIITMVGDLDYTVLWFEEADRRYAGPKVGALVPIKWLDEYSHHMQCPTTWHK